ncbi:hypothetical protein [Roseobacter sp. HKCC-CH-9208]|uniref:hypothetical protein n=1 Tax=Roseobacter sp. HKCC-CH-9208 TaxID=3120339 RepID=UPI0030ED2AB9
MVKINRDFLDPALGAINDHTAALVEKAKAQQNAVNAAAQAVADKAKSDLIFKTNISRGLMAATFFLGLGLLVALIAWALPDLVRAWKQPPPAPTPVITTAPTAEPTPEPNVVNPPPAYLVPTQELNANSNQCLDNSSYEAACTDDIVLPNGSTYSGTWRNGSANGTGTISFANGSSVTGTWTEGVLTEVTEVNAATNESAISKSVTLFTTTPGAQINSQFGAITAGHDFNSINDANWSAAFCYVDFFEGEDRLTIELSRIQNFNAGVVNFPYELTSRYTQRQYQQAQEACPYEYTNF